MSFLLKRSQQAHKSIKQFNEKTLPDFVILTGLNGSGKSHLLEAIQGRTIRVTDSDSKSIEKISLFNWTNFVPNNAQIFSSHNLIHERNNIWTKITQTRLHRHDRNIKILIDKFNLKKYFSPQNLPKSIGDISHLLNSDSESKQFFDELLSRVKAANEDILRQLPLSKEIDELFRKYIRQAKTVMIFFDEHMFFDKYLPATKYRTNIFQHAFSRVFVSYEHMRVENEFKKFRHLSKKHNISYLSDDEFKIQYGEKPWKIVNDILKRLGLNFKTTQPDCYNQKPFNACLLNKEGDSISFQDLSSGEKILLSFALCLYENIDDNHQINSPGIILFDEIDAPLHPSMTNKFFEIIQEVLIKDKKIKVIMTTHSPSTVAMAPDDSIFTINRNNQGQHYLKKTSKDKALSILTHGVTSLSINHENKKQVFLESKYDVENYKYIYDKLKDRNYLNHEVSLSFLSSGGKGENCDQVKNIVKKLHQYGNKNIFGIIDWDKKNNPSNSGRIFVAAHNKRYSIENLILDPFLVVAFLISDEREILFKHHHENMSLRSLHELEVEKRQDLVDEFIKILTGKDEDPNNLIECSYVGEFELKIPRWFLEERGHDLEKKITNKFVSLKKYCPKPKKPKESEEPKEPEEPKSNLLKKTILTKIVGEYPEFLPIEFIEVFRQIEGQDI